MPSITRYAISCSTYNAPLDAILPSITGMAKHLFAPCHPLTNDMSSQRRIILEITVDQVNPNTPGIPTNEPAVSLDASTVSASMVTTSCSPFAHALPRPPAQLTQPQPHPPHRRRIPPPNIEITQAHPYSSNSLPSATTWHVLHSQMTPIELRLSTSPS